MSAKKKAVKRKPREWKMWGVIASWGFRDVGTTKTQALNRRWVSTDKVVRVRITEVIK